MDLGANHSTVVILMAGVSFMIFGLTMASKSLQKLVAAQIRRLLNQLSGDSIIGVFVGVILTILMQSSGAVTATLVNLGTARVLTLSRVMGVLIGSAIGAALTVQLISMEVSHLGLPFFIVGFFGSLFAKKSKTQDLTEFLMALGILFFGLEMITGSANSFVKIGAFANALGYVRENPLIAVLLSGVITTAFQSSTATLGVVMGLAAGGALSVEDSVFWIFGANIGTTSTALMASMKGNYVGKRIAWANFMYRAATVILFLPFANLTLRLINKPVNTPATQIALFYMIMNLFAASIFFPLRKFGVQLIEKMVEPGDNEKEFGVRFLKRSTYESFAMGLAHAKREILEMGEIVNQMTELSLTLFFSDDPDVYSKVKELDDRVDLLLREIKFFLIRVSEQAPEGLNQSVIDLISFGSDLEGAADIIDHTIVELARKLHRQRLELAPESKEDLMGLHKSTLRAITLVLGCFQTEDVELAESLTDLKHDIRDLEKRIREAYIMRLGEGYKESVAASTVYLEVLAAYLQIVEILSRQARRVRKLKESTESATATAALKKS